MYTRPRARFVWLCAFTPALVATSCDREPAPVAEVRLARVRVAEVREVVPEVSSRHLVLLEPKRRARIAPRFGGQIAELAVVDQQTVNADDLLARLVDADARGSLQSARASRDTASERLADLERQLADAQDLLDVGAGTKREVERLESEVQATRHSIRQASGQVAQSRDRRDANLILAPFSGVVTSLDVEVGEYVGPGAALATLSELDVLAVEVPLSEREMVLHDRGGVRFEVRVRDELVPANLVWVAREADPGTNTFTARLELANPEQRLRAGESAEVDVRGATGEARLVVPATAIRWEGPRAYVLRSHREGEAETEGEGERERLERIDVGVHEDVELGPGQPPGVAIEGAIAAGDRVISSGPSTLIDGDFAIAVPQPGPAPAPTN
ncbi:efflux RND transporter periplasmic adaptor subunit [Nannocystaceae bacterium ST9]